MKKAIAVLTALIMGISCCPPGNVAMAAQNDETAAEEDEKGQDAESQESASNEESADTKESTDYKESGAEELQNTAEDDGRHRPVGNGWKGANLFGGVRRTQRRGNGWNIDHVGRHLQIIGAE